MIDVNQIIKKIVSFVEKNFYVFFAIILLVAIVNLFLNLANAPLIDFDESRHGINAYEMIQTGNYLINTFKYEPDYWNLKPPISFWSILLGFKIAGFNPLGLRLVSAVSTLLLLIIITFFVKYKHGRLAALISGSVLITSKQFILEHSARTGDADALFILFFSASIIGLLLMEKNIKWFYLAGFMFSLAFLTKSWHAGSIAIIIGFYLVFTKNILKLTIKNWLIFIFLIIFPILTWVIFRFYYDGTKFFTLMIQYDLLRRSSEGLEGNIGDFWYYFNLIQRDYFYWIIIFFAGLFSYLSMSSYNKMEITSKKYAFGIILWILIPFVVFTKAETKLSWYILPIFPALSIFTGFFASKIFKNNKNLLLNIILVSMIIFTLGKYEIDILRNIKTVNPSDSQMILKKLETKNEYHGYDIYIFENGWSQSNILAAELYGNLKAKDGNYDEFIKSSNAMLLLPKNEETTNLISSNELKILVESDQNYLVIN